MSRNSLLKTEQTQYLKFKWLQRGSDPQPLTSKTNTQPNTQPNIIWCFHGVEKGCIENKWINHSDSQYKTTYSDIYKLD